VNATSRPAAQSVTVSAESEVGMAAEEQEIIGQARLKDPTTLVDLLTDDDGDDTELEPGRLGLTRRTADL